jgi:hypothetical protein
MFYSSLSFFLSLSQLFHAKDGNRAKLETIFIRGSKIRLIRMPEMLLNSPSLLRSTAGGHRGERGGKMSMSGFGMNKRGRHQ